MKLYGEIDLNETPIVVLSCGHFFTAETLDGHTGMAEVYAQDTRGGFSGLRDVSVTLARSVPWCPDCQCPVRQYCTQRFNRVLNRAIVDEMSKRFLVDGKEELRRFEGDIAELERDLEGSRNEIVSFVRQGAAHLTGRLTLAKTSEVNRQLEDRYDKSKRLNKAIEAFCRKVSDKNQPARKLHDATVSAARRRSIDQLMTDLNVTESVPSIPRDRRITLGGRITQLQAECIMLTDSLSIAQVLKSDSTSSAIRMPKSGLGRPTKSFFKRCGTFVEECRIESLPKLGVEASLYYARIARSQQSYCRSTNTDVDHASDYIKTAKELMEKAYKLCAEPFETQRAFVVL